MNDLVKYNNSEIELTIRNFRIVQKGEKIKLTEKFIERKKRKYEELQLELNKMKECS